MHTVPASVQHSLNQPHYPTRHQYVEAKEPSDTPAVEDDGFHLTQVARGSWGFALTLVGKEFTGNIQIEADGTFSMRVTCNNKISQLTHWRFETLRDSMHDIYSEWMKGMLPYDQSM